MDSSCKLVDMYGNETDYLIRFSLLANDTKVLKDNQVSATVRNLMNVGSGWPPTTGGSDEAGFLLD